MCGCWRSTRRWRKRTASAWWWARPPRSSSRPSWSSGSPWSISSARCRWPCAAWSIPERNKWPKPSRRRASTPSPYFVAAPSKPIPARPIATTASFRAEPPRISAPRPRPAAPRCRRRCRPNRRGRAGGRRSGDRQRGRGLDLLHGEARGDVLERHRGDHALVERVITRDVGHHDAQHVVDVANHPVELHYVWHRADHLREAVEPVLGMIAGLDRDEPRDAEAELVLIEQRDALDQHAVGLQALNALPARRGRQPDPAADLGDRQR